MRACNVTDKLVDDALDWAYCTVFLYFEKLFIMFICK